MPVCKFFAKGSCHFGDKCWYDHIPNKNAPYYEELDSESYTYEASDSQSYKYEEPHSGNYKYEEPHSRSYTYEEPRYDNYSHQYQQPDDYHYYRNRHYDQYDDQYNDQSQNYSRNNKYTINKTYSNPKSVNVTKKHESDKTAIKEITSELKERKEWLYSSFGTNEVALPQFVDLSPEELRWATMQAKESGKMNILLQNLSNAQTFVELSQKDLLTSEAHLAEKLEKLAKGEKAFSTSIYLENIVKMATGLAYDHKTASQTSSTASTFFGVANQNRPSIFSSHSNQESIFGKNVPSTSLFGKTQSTQHSSQESLFGRTQPTTLFGKPVQQTNQYATQGDSAYSQNTGKSIFAPQEDTVPYERIIIPRTVDTYGDASNLDEEALEQYRAKDFTLGKIPLIPPPRELC